MSNASLIKTGKETPFEFLFRSLRTATRYLPKAESGHMNMIAKRNLPISLKGVSNWEGFLSFVFSWQPFDDGTHLKPGNEYSDWAVGLNLDTRDEDKILKEMEKVLFLCHYLGALVTISKISVKWSHLDEGLEKDGWLNESKELEDVLETLDKPGQLKDIQALGEKMRGLLRAIH